MTFNLRHQYVFILSLFMKTVTLCNSNNDTFKKQHLFKTGADSFVHTKKRFGNCLCVFLDLRFKRGKILYQRNWRTTS